MFLSITMIGLDAVKLKLAQKKVMLPIEMSRALQKIGDDTVDLLRGVTPVGTTSGDHAIPPEGDAPGHLRDSYVSTLEILSPQRQTMTVITTQPRKLRWVVEGRGPVRPRYKRALWWDGLPHPVRYARASTPNPFLTPTLDIARLMAATTFVSHIKTALE